MSKYLVNTMNDLMELDVKENDVVETLGFYTIGDGGNAKYLNQRRRKSIVYRKFYKRRLCS